VVVVLRSMGHTVHVFEFIEQAKHNKEGMNDFFVSVVKNGGYDLVFIETSRDEFFSDALDEARKYSITLAWNSDDDWRWEDYSSKWIDHFSYMVTTYRDIYESKKIHYPNLILSQWGCTGLFDGINTLKDIPLSFVGGIYESRVNLLEKISSRLPLKIYSRSSLPPQNWMEKGSRKIAKILYGQAIQPVVNYLDYSDVNDIWNRTKVSLTPLQAGKGGHLQIKGRVFEMGSSGTVMLCDRNPNLYEFYEPGKEFVEFDSEQDCYSKIRFLLTHETERIKIAEAYYHRTRSEHLWFHRYKKLFLQIGLHS